MASHGVTRTTRSRTAEQKQADLDKIAKYQDVEGQIRTRIRDPTAYSDPTLLQLTTKLVRLNPEYYTIWNVRRRCLTSGSLCRPSASSWPSRVSQSTLANDTTKTSSEGFSPSSSDSTPQDPKSLKAGKDGKSGTLAEGANDIGAGARDGASRVAETPHTGEAEKAEEDRIDTVTSTLQSELTFTIPLLLEYPKCYWIWNHRSWILTQAITLLPVAIARQIWLSELALASKMLVKDRRNFHAWSYRRSVVSKLESKALEGSSMAEAEFEYTTKMIRADLSNFSAWHNRSQLAMRVLDERNAGPEERKRFLKDELSLVQEGLNVGPEDQSLWYYHQFLMSQVAEYVGRATLAPALTADERIEIVEKEIVDIRDLLEDYEDVKWIYEVLLEYSIALEGLSESQRVGDGEDTRRDQETWLAKLRELDPMRAGRWDDVTNELNGRAR